jgi:hypothetical protein
MALEDLTGTKYIDSLNSSNPAAGDNVSEGDDHIRGIKNVLKTTFPSLDGAVTSTDAELNLLDGVTATTTELNYVDGVTSSIQTQLGTVSTTANAALPKAGGAMTGAITTNSTFDGRDVATDGTKLDTVETNADVTDTTNVTSAGALMDSEVTNLADVKAFDTTDYATSAQGSTADAALPKAGGTMTGNIVTGGNISLGDSNYLRFGTGNDLEIFHDGSNSYIKDTGTGNLYIRAENLVVEDADGTNYFVSNANAETKIYHNGSQKFVTTASGVEVTGSVQSSNGVFQLDSNDKIDINGANIGFHLDGAEDMRLENDGDLHVEGDVIAYSTTISDATLKYNINPVEFALDKIKQLKGVTFNYFKDNKASAGLLAQDVEKVMPSAVSERKLPLHAGDDKSYKTLHYDSMTAIFVEAIKELTAKVEKLEKK